MKKVKPRTIKQKRWVKEYIRTGNATEAAIMVYSAKNKTTAAVIGSENLKKLNMAESLQALGLTNHQLAKDVREGKDKSTKFFGSRDDFIEIPDYGVRHRYLETALRLSGHGPNRDVNVKVDARQQYYVALPERK